jgi:tetratricopeptide (TPR) repeat protein
VEHADSAVKLLDAVLEVVGDGPPDRLTVLLELGAALLTRHQITGRKRDLGRCRKVLEEALSVTPPNAPSRAATMANLASVLLALQAKDPALLDRAIALASEAREALGATPEAVDVTQALVTGLEQRFESSRASSDLVLAVVAAREALAIEGGDEGARSILAAFVRRIEESVSAELNDGVARLQRYEEHGDPLDLDAAQSSLLLAAELAAPAATDGAIALSGLGLALIKRHEVSGEPSTLNEALEHLEEAVRRASGDHSATPALQLNLGDGLTRKYEHTFAREDLEAAIRAYTAGLEEPHPSTTVAALLRAALGHALRMMWEGDGETARLNTAIELLDAAAPDLPSSSDTWAMARARLAAALMFRYETCGNLVDLHAAVWAAREAVGATDERAPGRGVRESGLARALAARGTRTAATSDLDEAISLLEGLIEREPRSRSVANRLSTLGAVLLDRYDACDEPADLSTAIDYLERSVELTDRGTAGRAARLANLGNALMRSYQAGGGLDLLERAVGVQREAGELAAGRPDHPSYLAGLAACLALLHHERHDDALLAEAVSAYRCACSEAAAESPNVELLVARNWGRFATSREAWEEAAEAYRHAVSATEELFRRQLVRSDKEAWLALAAPVPAMAAYALARADHAEEAVVALERTRTLLLSDALNRDRADLQGLRDEGAGDLVAAYQAAAERVQALERRALGGEEDIGPPVRDALAQARRDLDEVITRIHEVPNHEGFLAAPVLDDVRAAAADAPIAFVFAAEPEGMILTVGDGEPIVTRLPNLSQSVLVDRIRSYFNVYGQPAWRGAIDQMTGWLWPNLTGPLLDAVSAREIVIVPVGLLALLPIHAAWRPSEDGTGRPRYALDDALIRYAPSAVVLQHARAQANGEPARLVAAADNVALPHAQREVQEAAAHFNGEDAVMVVRKLSGLLGLVAGGDVVHLACHAETDLQEPLCSHLAIGDDVLTAADLMSRRSVHMCLAALSACETALPGTDLPDEAVGLATALLEAGASGVVASLWRVPDLGTLALMSRFYELWRADGLPPAVSLRRAQQWVREASNADLRERFPDVPEFAGLEVPEWLRADWNEAHNLQTPYHWAAFTYTGA